MAEQGTEGQTSSDQSPAEEASGRHRASDEGATEQSAPADGATESAPSEAKTESAPSEAKTERSAPSEAKTEQVASPEQQQRSGDTSWAEPETPQRRHVDVGEIAWRAGNVLATVVRTLAFLFALVLIVNVVLVLVGVNPANGVAQFIGGLADRVILGFRDLFVPADPTIGLIVNSLVAAAFWVFVGELLSRLIRFLAARVK